jgi:uncharacterized membrane protein
MKKLKTFLVTSLTGGIFVLLPLLLLFLALSEIMELLVAMATPIADLFPANTFHWIGDPWFIAILILTVCSFFFGLALYSPQLSYLGRWIDSNALGKLPLYRAFKKLGSGLLDREDDEAFQSGILHHADGFEELVYVMENHGNGKMTVMLPVAPTAFSGRLLVVSADRVKVIGASFGEASKVISQWGSGLQELIKKGSSIQVNKTKKTIGEVT